MKKIVRITSIITLFFKLQIAFASYVQLYDPSKSIVDNEFTGKLESITYCDLLNAETKEPPCDARARWQKNFIQVNITNSNSTIGVIYSAEEALQDYGVSS